jgi:phosphocarrier protein
MIEKIVCIKNKLGLHARPAALFVSTAAKFKSSLRVVLEDREADGKSVMGVLMLIAGEGSQLKIIASGPDENELISSIENLVNENKKFNEE